MPIWSAISRARKISSDAVSRPDRLGRDVLMDVSRLVWRFWRGGLPTGVDRVCAAYVSHYRARSRAVLQWRGRHIVLNSASSDRLFDLFDYGRDGFRPRFAAFVARAMLGRAFERPKRGLLYLNIGHTGLNEPSLPLWIAREQIRAIYFIHDLIPLTHPQFCRAGESDKHALRMHNVLASATGVIGNSQATIDDLQAFATDRGLPMPSAVAAFIAGPPLPPALSPHLDDRPYFITVGTIEGRKNHILLLRIWKKLAHHLGDEAPLLRIVGQRGWESAEALAILDGGSLKAHVRELGTCADDKLAKLVAGARALLMPSFVEGYGLPVAEALALGTPVIAGDLPVYREFAADIPTYVDVRDQDRWETTILSFLGESVERERQRQAMRQFRSPDWPSHFQHVDQWLGALPQDD